MALNTKQITDWLNEAQQDFNRPMGQPSKTGAYAKFLVNAVPIVYTLLKKIEQLKSEATRRDAELLKKVEGMRKVVSGHENCLGNMDGCDVCDGHYNQAITDMIKLIKGE